MAATTKRQIGSRVGPAARRTGELLGRHRLVLLTGLAASLPVIVSAVYAVAVGWVPVGDNAIIAARAYDVLTTHTPLLGQYSLSSGLSGAATYSPGPMEYWLLALPARLFDPAALAVTVSLANIASVMGVVALAKRRGGLPLMFGTGVAVALLCSSLGAEALHSVWNPLAALLPFTLLAFLCWSVACGDFKLLPLTVLVASFVVECHLSYAIPAVGLLTVALGGLLASRRTISWPSLRRWALAALLVGLVCWSAPLVDQAIHRPGNMHLLLRGAGSGQPRVGADGALKALVRGVGIPPWWLRDQQSAAARFQELGAKPSPLAVASCVAILAGVALVTLLGLRRRRRDVAAAGCTALTLCAALVLVPALTPSGHLIPTLAYMLQWGAPVGMFAWLALAWGAGTLWRPAWRPRAARPSLLAYAGLGLVALVGLGVAAATGSDRQESRYGPIRSLASRLGSDLPDGSSVRVDITRGSSGSVHAFDVQTGSVYALRQHGFSVTAPSMKRLLGHWYAEQRRLDHVLELGPRATSTGRPIIRIDAPDNRTPGERKLGSRRPDPPIWVTLSTFP